MRRWFESPRTWACLAVLAAPSALIGCPGHIDDKAPYLLALEGAGGASGAPGTGGAGGVAGGSGQAGQAGCGDVPTSVFLPTCGPQGCHGGAKPASKLDLASPGVAARVVGVPGAACGDVLADPQNPEKSLIYQKIAVAIPTCGGRMPLGIDPLDDAAIACVAAWIGSLGQDGGAPADAAAD